MPSEGRILNANIRGPVSFTQADDGRLVAGRGGGGVVSALSSAIASNGTLWICAAQNDADRAQIRKSAGGRLSLDGSPGGSEVRMLDIPAATFRRAHNAVANSTLWFVHHMLYDTPHLPRFGPEFESEWQAYRAYNHAFAQALAQEAGAPLDGWPTECRAIRAVVHDYHLTLVPRMLADVHPDVRIAHFSHTPWAPPDYYRILPRSVGRQVLEGVLGADHAGFHCQRWADAFLECCRVILGADVDRRTQQVSHRGHVTSVGVHPLGVDADELRRRGSEPDVQAKLAALVRETRGRKLIVRIDRTELSKNILRGLEAYRELLVTHPEWRGRVTHQVLAYPSRQDIPVYRMYMAAVTRMASEISAEFGTQDWQPLVVEVNNDYPRALAMYQLADVVLVNPVRDGMNLVAKEAAILSGSGCALVLSEEAGAAAELGADALLVNPYDVSETARAMHEGLIMTDVERKRRGASLARAAAAHPPSRWFADQLAALDIS